MKKQDDLFTLIKTMTSAEKRHFKLVSKTNDRNQNYIELFDVLDKLKEYDEVKVKTKLAGKKFAKHLSSEKKNLQNALFKSLRVYHEKSTTRSIGYKELATIDLLIKRDIYDLTNKLIAKNEKIYKTHENFSLLTALYDYKEILLIKKPSIATKNDWDEYFEKKEEFLEKNIIINRYRRIERNLMQIYSKTRFLEISPEEWEELQDIKSTELIKNDTQANSLEAKYRYLQANALIALLEKNYHLEAQFFKSLLDSIDKHPLIKEPFYQEYYYSTYSNYISALIMSKDLFTANKEIETVFKRMGLLTHKITTFVYYQFYTNEILCVIRIGDSNKINALIKKINSLLIHSGNEIPFNLKKDLMFGLYILLFVNREYKECINHLKLIIEDDSFSNFHGYLTYSRILILFNYLELNQIDMVEYYYNSTVYFQKKINDNSGLNKEIINFFKIYIKDNGRLSSGHYLDFKKNIKEFLVKSGNNFFLEYFDLNSWIESKIKKISFKKAIQIHNSIKKMPNQ